MPTLDLGESIKTESIISKFFWTRENTLGLNEETRQNGGKCTDHHIHLFMFTGSSPGQEKVQFHFLTNT
jgi:hypothetical protein